MPSDSDYRFDFREGQLALNVKYYKSWPLPTGQAKRRLARLEKEDSRHADSLRSCAYEIAQQDWWENTAEWVKEEGYGRIYCDGRSGGWLVFRDIDRQSIEDYLRTLSEPCVFCREPRGAHGPEGKCLFDATTYADSDGSFPNDETVKDARAQLDAISALLNRVSESVEQASEHYKIVLTERVDEVWNERLYLQEAERQSRIRRRVQSRALRLANTLLNGRTPDKRRAAEAKLRDLYAKNPWLGKRSVGEKK